MRGRGALSESWGGCSAAEGRPTHPHAPVSSCVWRLMYSSRWVVALAAEKSLAEGRAKVSGAKPWAVKVDTRIDEKKVAVAVPVYTGHGCKHNTQH